jgi:hypothetical protein
LRQVGEIATPKARQAQAAAESSREIARGSPARGRVGVRL